MLRLQKSLLFNGRAQKEDNLEVIKSVLLFLGFILLIVVALWMKK